MSSPPGQVVKILGGTFSWVILSYVIILLRSCKINLAVLVIYNNVLHLASFWQSSFVAYILSYLSN